MGAEGGCVEGGGGGGFFCCEGIEGDSAWNRHVFVVDIFDCHLLQSAGHYPEDRSSSSLELRQKSQVHFLGLSRVYFERAPRRRRTIVETDQKR